MGSKRPIAYYVSAHGYGHGVRSCDILRAIHAVRPDVPVILTSDLPGPFLQNRLAGQQVSLRSGRFDVGMVQLDSIKVDVPATLREVEALYAKREESVATEAAFLRDQDAAVVVADIPAMPLEAARRAGIPGVAVGNFAWDWIYSAFVARDPRWQALVDQLAQGYAQADLLLRLPLAEQMKAFPCKEDIGLLASPGRNRRTEIARLAGCREDRKWVLLSFTALDWGEEALARVETLRDYEFFTVLPLGWERRNIHAIQREKASFSDILASADAVITKPGFGIISECFVNRKPMLYAERTDFIEYPILEAGIRRYLKSRHLPAEQLYRGDIAEALEALWSASEPSDTLPAGGDRAAAETILGFHGGGPAFQRR